MRFVLLGNEKENCLVDRFMRRFNDFIDKYALMDVPLAGNDYTWARGLVEPSLSKLNRFLI